MKSSFLPGWACNSYRIRNLAQTWHIGVAKFPAKHWFSDWLSLDLEPQAFDRPSILAQEILSIKRNPELLSILK
jgi:hypothetical protein